MSNYEKIFEKLKKRNEKKSKRQIKNSRRASSALDKGYLFDRTGEYTYAPVDKQRRTPRFIEEDKSVGRKKRNSNKVTPRFIEDERLYEYEAEYISKKDKKKRKSKKKKGIIISAISLLMAGVMATTAIIMFNKNKKKDLVKGKDDTSLSNSVDGMDSVNLNDLGEKLPTSKTKQYTKISGDITLEDIVRGSDGDLYDSQESADNANKVGSVEIDTKGGTLVVGDNGKVYESEEGYEIVDKDGQVIESGNGKPEEQEGGIDYVECPCNYYDDEGTLVHPAGELITPEELELCKQYYHTQPPKSGEYDKQEISYETYKEEPEEDTDDNAVAPTGSAYNDQEEYSEETQETETINSNAGTTNADGTYTIYGQTYASYADYQQYIIDGGEGYGEVDGIIQPITGYEIEKQYTK